MHKRKLMRQSKLLLIMMTLLGCLAVSRCDEWTPPSSWTLRSDGILRRALSAAECKKLGLPAGCVEQYTMADWLSKIAKEEKDKYSNPYQFGVCITPNGAAAITKEILYLEGQ